jgi:prevent-host-death family protein
VKTELVTTLKRKATDILSELANDQEPVLITQHGRPAAYLIDVESYDAMRQRMQLLEGIARGERAIDQDRLVTHAAAKKRMHRWLS